MFGLNALDVAIGLAFVYLLLSLICTTVNEWIASLRAWRGKTLRQSIEVLLSGDTRKPDQPSELLSKFYAHPQVAVLFRGKRWPSYIPPRTFAVALMQSVARPPESGGASAPDSGLTARFRAGLDGMADSHVKRSLQSLLELRGAASTAGSGTAAERGLEEDIALIERWFNDTMDRATGWYKRRAQLVSAVIAVGVTLMVNADTLSMGRQLWTNPALREQIVAEAKACVEKAQPDQDADYEYADPDNPDPSPPVKVIREACVDRQKSEALLGQLTGWDEDLKKWDDLSRQAPPGKTAGFSEVLWPWLLGLLGTHLAGWAITAIALSLGAQFWFERLKNFVKLRGSGKALLTEVSGAAAAK